MSIKIDIYLIFSIIILFFFRQAEAFLIFYFFVLLHELAHILVANLLKIKIIDISLLPFGVNAKFDFCDNKIKEIIIASAGPVFSLIIACILKEYFIQNFFIFVVNMIPIYPLDGGRILKNIILLVFKNSMGRLIYRIILKIAIIILVTLNIVLVVFFKMYNFIFVCLYIIQLASDEIKKDDYKEQISSLLNLEI